MAAAEIELVLDAHAAFGESPTWSAHEQALYWIDIRAPALHRYDPASGAAGAWRMPDEIGCFALREAGGGAIIGLRSGLHTLDFATGELVQRAGPPYDPALHRFNEGACDGTGRFWLGTMFEPKRPYRGDPQPGALFSYTAQTGLVPHRDLALTPNGLAWSGDGRTLYFAHSEQRTIYAFAFDGAAGRLGRRLLFATVPANFGVPDGAAVDVEGCYWSAVHGGGRIRRYRPNGEVDRDIALPVSCPTMCAFGGAALDVLYITSAAEGAGRPASEPHAGGVFRCRPGVRGLPRSGFAG